MCSPPQVEPPADPPADPGDPADPADPGTSLGAAGTRTVAVGWTLGSSPGSGELPRTGSDTLPLARAALVLLATGALLVVLSGRRRTRVRRPADGVARGPVATTEPAP